jgi:alpha-tubulin suppressor-like RCC1 family protein
VYATGKNSSGQLGDNSTTDRTTFFNIYNQGAIAGKEIVQVAAGNDHSLALSSDGFVYCWGSNTYGQLGDDTTTQRTVPVAVNGGITSKVIVKISAAGNSSFALASDGSVFSWGYGGNYQLGNGSTGVVKTPTNLSRYGLDGIFITMISAGGYLCVALSNDGRVFTWGWNGATTSQFPTEITTSGALNGRVITNVSAGREHALAISSDNTVIGWGSNQDYQVGDGTTTNRTTPVISTRLNGLNVTSIAAGSNYNIALTSSNKVYTWGKNENGNLGDPLNYETRLATPVNVPAFPYSPYYT